MLSLRLAVARSPSNFITWFDWVSVVFSIAMPVTNNGDVSNTARPVPVFVVSAASRLALDGVAKKVATPAPRPLTPVEIGRPVALVSVPDDGVPSAPLKVTGAPADPTL